MTVAQWQGPGTVDWVVPAQVTSIDLELWGAGNSPNYISTAGRVVFGGYRRITLAVTPGETLRFTLGGAPVRLANNTGTSGGFNGGGTGGGGFPRGGAGATDCRQGGTALANRVAVAGGAGGAAGELGGYTFGQPSTDNRGGGPGGGDTGGVGAQVPATVSAAGGRGGTQAAGGAAGTGGLNGNGTAGSSGQGGNGGITKTAAQVTTDGFNTGGTGGGGGGYFGGGGASAPAVTNFYGGGAGSNYPAVAAGGTSSQNVAPPTWGTDFNGDSVIDAPQGFARVTYNAPPNAPTLTAFDNGDDTAGVALAWAHSDPEGDAQSRADVRWRVGSGAWTTIAPAVSSATAAYTLAAGTFNTAGVIGQLVEWQVQTRTADGLISPWSDSAFFTPRQEPAAAPTVTGPAALNTRTPSVRIQSGTAFNYYKIDVTGSDASSYPGQWTTVGGAATTDTTVTYDSIANGVPFTSGVTYTFRVRVSVYTNNPVPSAQGNSAGVVAAVSAPSVPTLVLTPVAANAAVQVAITNPNFGTDATPPVSNDVYRTDQTNNTPEVRVATGVPLNSVWTDWQPALNVTYRYRVVAVSATGANTSSA